MHGKATLCALSYFMHGKATLCALSYFMHGLSVLGPLPYRLQEQILLYELYAFYTDPTPLHKVIVDSH